MPSTSRIAPRLVHRTRLMARMACTALGLGLASTAHAVVEPGHWRTFTDSFSPSNFNISVDQTPDGDDTGLFLDYTAGNLKGITYNVDEGADLFVVQPGTVFTEAWGTLHPESFLGGTSQERSSGPADRQLTPSTGIHVGTDFYLGAQTRSRTYVGFSVFGWAHFKVDALGRPQLIDSAMAFNEVGIVVGTLQAAVPEPGTAGLMALGLTGLLAAGARRTRA